jgi:predicted dehydrogenase
MITAVVVGAGQRGHDVYGAWARAHPDRIAVLAISDPDPDRLRRMGAAHHLPEAARFRSAGELWQQGRIADLCIVATPDRHHYAPAMAAIELGYHLLVEKPMASTLAACADLVEAARRARSTVTVAHVLRFTAFFRALHEAMGSVGEVVRVHHTENVAAWHMAHSFVRGNWSRTIDATPMIVQKCSHDFDILCWNLPGRARRIASTGGLFEFRPERAPAVATDRCTDPCPVLDCPYDARRIYLDPRRTGWPVSVVTDDPSPEARSQALAHGPYGVCAYRAGSDVVDHQVVIMEMDDGVVATLEMHGHSPEEGRTMRYDGTRASLRGVFGARQELTITDHATGRSRAVPIRPEAPGGHGGGDDGLMEAVLTAVETGRPGPTDAVTSFESHLLAFAAEEARVAGTWLDLADRRPTTFGPHM